MSKFLQCKVIFEHGIYGSITKFSLPFNNTLLKNVLNPRITSVYFVNSSKPKSITPPAVQNDIPEKIRQEILAWRPTPSTTKSSLLQEYMKLSKIRLTTFVVITSMAGYAVAPAPFHWADFGLCILGTGLLSSAANAFNQFHETPFDAQMARTKQRVLVCGRITQLHAIYFATLASISGLSILYFGVNGLSAALGATNLILYSFIYTPLKRISILNTWVGCCVGAIPPLMGWAACTNSLGPGAWLLAALLYSWQFPHFNALSWNLRPDYSRAGYRMMSVTDPDLCRRVALRHTIAIEGMCLLAPVLETTNWWFVLESAPVNLYFIYLAYKFYQDSSSSSSRKLFRYSLIHLPIVMLLFLINKKKWFIFEKPAENTN